MGEREREVALVERSGLDVGGVCYRTSMAWLQADKASGFSYRCKNNKLCVDVRFCEVHLYTTVIQSETVAKFFYDITKILERNFRGGAGSSTGNYLNFLEDSLSIPLDGVLPKNFQIGDKDMRGKLKSDILKLARDAAQKFEQNQRSQEEASQPKYSEEAAVSVDECLAVVEQSFGRQRVDEDGRPMKVHGDDEAVDSCKPDSVSNTEGFGLCCPMDKLDEAWLSQCMDFGKACQEPLIS